MSKTQLSAVELRARVREAGTGKLVLKGAEFTLGGALRGAGDTRFPLYTVLTGLIGVRVLLSAIFVWLGLGVEWIFAALIADYIVKGGMLTWRFRGGAWKHLQIGAREA